MVLTVRDNEFRYRIACPDGCEVRAGGEFDYLVVEAPEFGGPLWLFDELLVEAARSGDFGLQLLSEVPLS